jgi:indoleacetamide hydrolase
LPSIVGFLRAQDNGLTFERMLAMVDPHMREFFEQHAMPPHRPPDELYATMCARQDEIRTAVRQHFAAQRIDALALPATGALAPRIGDAAADVNGSNVSFFAAFGRNTALSAVASTPSLVLPVGLSKKSLPISLEFNAINGQDRRLLALGLSISATLGPISAPTAG